MSDFNVNNATKQAVIDDEIRAEAEKLLNGDAAVKIEHALEVKIDA